MPTDSALKVGTDHLRRDAFLYVRQSSLRQVFENTESTKRQYALRERAVALGWPAELVSDAREVEDQLDLWLIAGADRFKRDREVSRALVNLAKQDDSRNCLSLLKEILETPGLAARLTTVLKEECVERVA